VGNVNRELKRLGKAVYGLTHQGENLKLKRFVISPVHKNGEKKTILLEVRSLRQENEGSAWGGFRQVKVGVSRR